MAIFRFFEFGVFFSGCPTNNFGPWHLFSKIFNKYHTRVLSLGIDEEFFCRKTPFERDFFTLRSPGTPFFTKSLKNRRFLSQNSLKIGRKQFLRGFRMRGIRIWRNYFILTIQISKNDHAGMPKWSKLI